jgi:hypothetical protein
LLDPATVSDETEHHQFPVSKVFVSHMLSETRRHRRWNVTPRRVDQSGDIEQFIFRQALEDVRRSSSTAFRSKAIELMPQVEKRRDI